MSRPITRRALFGRELFGLLRRVTQEPEESGSLPRGVLRPPGAVAEERLRVLCDSCGECVAACPHEAVRLLGPSHGALQGTPAVIPREQPCLWCEGFPCVEACTRGALVSERVQRGMGVARVDPDRCLLARGLWCDQCVHKCPFAGEAIRVGRDWRIRVDAEACVGCGLCEWACPTDPPAIRVRVARG